MMKIGNIELKNNLILAPMAGVSDVGFRRLAVQSGADFAVCEMVSAKALYYKNTKTLALLNTTSDESIKVAQLFGSDPAIMAWACTHPALEKFDIIDINMGCPAPKIVNNGEGSALLKHMDLAYNIIHACVQATKKPITVKFRIGFDEKNIVAIEFAKMCQKAGASAITVHGRTREQYYSGKVNLEVIKAVKQAVSIPVIGNGDVVDKESYEAMLACGVDAVMIGRGALGNPTIFATLLGKPKQSRWECLRQHVDTMLSFYDEEFVLLEMRKHFLWYLKGIHGVSEVKNKVVTMTNLKEVMNLLQSILERSEND